MNQLQTKLLDMLKAFHRFCVFNNLRYYAQGGTMLGAVRHEGFIPWDDDIDVGMPRDDFEKLSVLLGCDRMEEKYILETPMSTDPRFCYPYSKLYDISTTLIENTRQQLRRGIFIDIFPLDGIGNSLEEVKQNYKEIDLLRKRLALRKVKISRDRVWYKNITLLVAQNVNIDLFNEKKICLRLDEICKSRSLHDYSFGGNLLGAWGIKEVVPVSVIGEPELYKFENTEIFGVKKYDEYLTKMYGDWRKLPPKEKQISHHDYYLDLKKSYMEER